MMNTYDLRKQAREAIDEAIENKYYDCLEDGLHEIADGLVPIYTSDLMSLAADNIEFAVNVPELGPAFDGSDTPVNIVAANVYEWLIAELYEYASELELA